MALNWGVFGGNMLGGLGQGMNQGQQFMQNYQNYQQQQQMNPLLLEHQRLANQRQQQILQQYPQEMTMWDVLARYGLGPQGGQGGYPAAAGGTNMVNAIEPIMFGSQGMTGNIPGVQPGATSYDWIGQVPLGNVGIPAWSSSQPTDPFSRLWGEYQSMFGVR